jgi:hypothetical protein
LRFSCAASHAVSSMWVCSMQCMVCRYAVFLIMQYAVYSMQYLVYGIQYTIYSIQYTVYSIQCNYAVYSMRYTVYNYLVYNYTVCSIQYGMQYAVCGSTACNLYSITVCGIQYPRYTEVYSMQCSQYVVYNCIQLYTVCGVLIRYTVNTVCSQCGIR